MDGMMYIGVFRGLPGLWSVLELAILQPLFAESSRIYFYDAGDDDTIMSLVLNYGSIDTP